MGQAAYDVTEKPAESVIWIEVHCDQERHEASDEAHDCREVKDQKTFEASESASLRWAFFLRQIILPLIKNAVHFKDITLLDLRSQLSFT